MLDAVVESGGGTRCCGTIVAMPVTTIAKILDLVYTRIDHPVQTGRSTAVVTA